MGGVPIQRVYVAAVDAAHDAAGRDLLYEVRHTLAIESLSHVRTAKVYRFEGIDAATANWLAANLLVDVGESFRLNASPFDDSAERIEVAFRPGVMNPESASLQKAVWELGIAAVQAADSARAYGFYGRPSAGEIDQVVRRLLVNPTIEEIVVGPPGTLRPHSRRAGVGIVPLREMDDHALMTLSRDTLFLDLDEMRAVREHFVTLDRDPTDGEIETIAQTWSEHCVHKTFKAPIEVDGLVKPSLFARLRAESERHPGGVVSAFVDNAGVIELYDGWSICAKVETHNSPAAIEPYGGAMTGSGGVFRDILGTGQGARVIASTDMFCVAPPDLPADEVPPGCLAPRYLLRRIVAGVRDYGNRTGIPTCNGSVHFHPDFRAKPSVIVGAYGLLPTERACKGSPMPGDLVIAVGGRTGRDGIHGVTFASAAMTGRTGDVNASAVQIGNAIEEKRVIDAVLACRDAGLIRALTDCGGGGFSSAIGEMGRATGVRVDVDRAALKYDGLAPWEVWVSESQERMVLAVDPAVGDRVIGVCRDHNVEAVVLGEFTDDRRLRVDAGATVLCDLDMDFLHEGIPLRTLVAAPDPSRMGSARVGPSEGVGRADSAEPHAGTDQAAPPSASSASAPPAAVPLAPVRPALVHLALADGWRSILLDVLAHGDVCSKEPIVRMYDHNVQGSSVLPPFLGVRHDGPGDAAVLAPVLGKPYGVVIAHGLNPVATRLDPYMGTLWSIAEAVANACAVGARLQDLALIDNFIWPSPDAHWLWALDQAVEACVAAMATLGIPFISGKDSLSSTYRWPSGERLDIPPVLCVSAFGRIPDVGQTVSSDLKEVGSSLVLLGHRDCSLGASVYAAVTTADRGGVGVGAGGDVAVRAAVAGRGRASGDFAALTDAGCGGEMVVHGPRVDLDGLVATTSAVHESIAQGAVLACHDVSQGGLLVAAIEMALGGDLGLVLVGDPPGDAAGVGLSGGSPTNAAATADDADGVRADPTAACSIRKGAVVAELFAETAGCFVVETTSPAVVLAVAARHGVPSRVVGWTTQVNDVTVRVGADELFTVALEVCRLRWQQPMREVFHGIAGPGDQ